MIETRKFPTPKRILFRIHRDLQKAIVPFDAVGREDLSDFETLVLLLEDRRFPDHRGVDFYSVGREVWRLVTFRRHGGASTIDMQYVRTRTGYKQLKLSRKLYEMLLAFLLQYHMSKIAILRSYLQIAYFGSGLYGADAAAREVFGRSIWELEKEESAFIAAMLVYPRPSEPTPRWKYRVERRASYGLRLFARLGHRYKQRLE